MTDDNKRKYVELLEAASQLLNDDGQLAEGRLLMGFGDGLAGTEVAEDHSLRGSMAYRKGLSVASDAWGAL